MKKLFTAGRAALLAGSLLFSSGVSYGADTPVTVTNPTAAPVPVKDQNNPAYHPLTLYLKFDCTCSSLSGPLQDLNTNAYFTVPPGKRFVVESFSGHTDAVTGPRVRFFLKLANLNYSLFEMPTTGGPLGTFNNQKWDGYEGMTPMRWYVDEGNTIHAGVSRYNFFERMYGTIVITGHLVDLPTPGTAPY